MEGRKFITANISITQLLETGAHFGHHINRWNPKMAEYIFTERNGIHIIDLEKTMIKIEEACNFITKIVSEGGEVLFVGKRASYSEIIKEEALRCNMRYMNDDMEYHPDAVIIANMIEDHDAIQQARSLGIPIIALADTICDPDDADYVIPCNDDAVRAVKLVIGTLADAILEAKK